jgi:hypothetical protein
MPRRRAMKKRTRTREHRQEYDILERGWVGKKFINKMVSLSTLQYT